MYNSCQDRHCPTCQTSTKEKWLSKRCEELLPVPYFHSVFTLPHDINGLIDANRKLLLGELFSTVNWVLQRFAHDPRWRLEGLLGFVAVLHTWTQKLQEHFHLHCIVPGGVWREETQQWVPCRGQWLFRKDSLATAFRNRYLKRLCRLRRQDKLHFSGAAAVLADEDHWNEWIAKLANTAWIVYPKPAPGGSEIVLNYLGRYTHKVAISNHRIKTLNDGLVTYTWRDRSDQNTEKLDTIPAEVFTKRFCYHILPRGFQKIRYYGWLSAAKRKETLPAIRKALNVPPPEPKPELPLAEHIFERIGLDITLCPCCGTGHPRKTTMRIPRSYQAQAP
jgi:hypothetical protein